MSDVVETGDVPRFVYFVRAYSMCVGVYLLCQRNYDTCVRILPFLCLSIHHIDTEIVFFTLMPLLFVLETLCSISISVLLN